MLPSKTQSVHSFWLIALKSMELTKSEHIRLSRFVIFVQYGDYVELQHSVRKKKYVIDIQTYQHLRSFLRFKPFVLKLSLWIERGVLVFPYIDTFSYHGSVVDSEADLSIRYNKWYWDHEIETEREYMWLGKVVVKMPSDLFFYQEILTKLLNPSVLELGYGHGGGLYYFASILSLRGGGNVVGIDHTTNIDDTDYTRWPQVTVSQIQADALHKSSIKKVIAKSPKYDLIIADLGGDPDINFKALHLWSSLVTNKGIFVLEDLWGFKDETEIISRIDSFLLNNNNFGFCESAHRFPLLKGIALTRLK